MMNFFEIISKFEITLWGSYAWFAIGSMIYTLYSIVKYIVKNIKVEKEEDKEEQVKG